MGEGSELGVLEPCWRELRAGDACRWRRGAWCRPQGEGDADMGRRWPAWWRLREQEWQKRGPGELWRCLSEREWREWGLRAGEAWWRPGARQSRGGECLAGGGGGAIVGALSSVEGSGPHGVRGGCHTGVLRCCRVWGGRWKAPRPPWICRLGGLRRVRWVLWREWQVVRVQWWLREVSRVAVAFGGLALAWAVTVPGNHNPNSNLELGGQGCFWCCYCRPSRDSWGCVWWCWWCWWRCWCLLLGWCLRLGSGFGLGSGLGLQTGSRFKTTSSKKCWGSSPGREGFQACFRGAGVVCVAVWGPPTACFVAAALALDVALWMRWAVRGNQEVEDDDDDEEAEEVVVLGDAGCADMRAGAAVQAASAPAAATLGRMEAISSGCGLAAAGCKGSAAIQRNGPQRCVGQAWGCGLQRLSSAVLSKKKSFSNALGYTLVVLCML